MKCPECGGVGRIHYGEEWCFACNGTGEVQTNEEWFDTLSTEEKAEFFANIYPKSVGEALIKISNGDKESWAKWLKQPHTQVPKKQEKRK